MGISGWLLFMGQCHYSGLWDSRSINRGTGSFGNLLCNIANNLDLFQAGQHANNILTPEFNNLLQQLVGTGATLVITLMFAFMSKSKN